MRRRGSTSRWRRTASRPSRVNSRATRGECVRQRWGGSLLEEATLSGGVKLLTVAQHVVEAAAPVPVEPFAPELSEADLAVRVVRREEPPPGTVSLTDARVVVGGGRGVGSAEGFVLLEELAALLGGAVGGSRVVTNLGWRAHSDQVGQTAPGSPPTSTSPVGSAERSSTSSAARERRRSSRSTRTRTRRCSRADYAVVGDLHEVVAAVIAELQR